METVVEFVQENEKPIEKEYGPRQGKLPPLQPLEVTIVQRLFLCILVVFYIP